MSLPISGKPLTPQEEETVLVDELRKLRAAGFGDLLVSVHLGRMDKLDVTLKRRGDQLVNMRRLRENV